ncbi:carbohydrate ABC transporter permease [Streptomyces sp. NPDC058357]|uniref:carbohydrate ABC transporter permease n=1 Tax=unclassified Streptomyces TaxID=2593676 RepID=UPI00365F7736
MAVSTTHRTESRSVRTSPGSGETAGNRFRNWFRRGGFSAVLFALPTVLVFAYFSWWPIFKSLLMSVQKTNLVTEPTWVGWRNFELVLDDPLLKTAVLNTTWYVALALVFGFAVPVFYGVLIAELGRARVLVSALAYIPVVLPPVVSTLLWKQFYDPGENGLFNTVAGWFGAGPFPWLQSAVLAMPSIVVQTTWAGFGAATLVYLAAMSSVPRELYESAEVDGAGILRRVWHVTLPHLRGVMLLLLLLQLIGTFQLFTEPYVMTGGGPANSTLTILMLIFRYAFVYNDLGKATALSLLLAVALSVLSAIYLWATRKWSKA